MNNKAFRFKGTRPTGAFVALLFVTIGVAAACHTDTIPEDSAAGAGGGPFGSSGASHAAGRAGAPSNGDAGTEESAGTSPEVAGSPQGGAEPSTGGMPTGGSGQAGGGTGGQIQNGAVCGNNKLEPGEECDDGNIKDGDGCSATCTNKCEKCEQTWCGKDSTIGAEFSSCFSNKMLATGGPSAGTAKDVLCQAVVSCVRRTKCGLATGDVIIPCFCGSASAKDCQDPTKGPLGECADDIAAAAESADFASVAQHAANSSFAVGAAAAVLASCDRSACASECLGNKALSACERCTLGADPTDFSFVSPFGAYNSCYFDQQKNCDPAAPPSLNCASVTCAPAADCALSTGCAVSGVANCYAAGSGPCAKEFAAAAGSTDAATVVVRLSEDSEYASGVLTQLLDSERNQCRSTCFPNASSAGGSGVGGGN